MPTQDELLQNKPTPPRLPPPASGIGDAARQAAGAAPRLAPPAAPVTSVAPVAPASTLTQAAQAAAGAAAPGRPPVRPGSPEVIDITPRPEAPVAVTQGAPTSIAPDAAPAPRVLPAPPPRTPRVSSKPPSPDFTRDTMYANGDQQMALDDSARSRIGQAEPAAQQSRAAAAARVTNSPANAGPPKPDVATMRQQLGLNPEPPAAAPAPSGPGAASRMGQAAREAAGKGFGTGENWSQFGADVASKGGRILAKAAPALKLAGKAAKVAAAPIGAYETYQGLRDGDMGKAAWGAADTAAGAALFTPAAPAAAVYLTGRGAWEGGKMIGEHLPDSTNDAIGSGINRIVHGAGKLVGQDWGVDPDKAAADIAKIQAPPAQKAPQPTTPPAKPAQPAAKPAPAAATPAPAPAQRALPDYSGMAANARDEALATIDQEEGRMPNAVYAQTSNQKDGSTTYETRDGNQIRVQAPTDVDRKLAQRVSVVDGFPEAGPTFIQDDKVYKNVVVGKDEVGKPIIRAISVDGQANNNPQVNDASLVRQWDEAQARLAGPAQADGERIGAFQDRQGRRDAIHDRYMQAIAAIGEGANSGPVADAARASASQLAATTSGTPPAGAINSKVAAFKQQNAALAQAVGEKLGVDPDVVLAHWGQETGWGKSVIPGTNNLGNIKAGKGQGGVAATDNMTGSRDNYQKFDDPQAFADRYVDLLKTRYPGVVGAGGDMGKFAGALAGGGYAQDPAYANKLQAVYRSVTGGGAPAAAPVQSTRPVRNPMSPVEVIDMNSGIVNMTEPGLGSVFNGMSKADYQTYRNVIARNPDLAKNLSFGDNGPTLDGLPVPANVLAGGKDVLRKWADNYAQAQRFAVNKTGGEMAKDAVQGEYNLRGREIEAAAQKEVAKTNAGVHRFAKSDGGTDPKTFQKLPDRKFDTTTGEDTPILPPRAIALQQAQTAADLGGDINMINMHLQSMYPELSVKPKSAKK